MKSRYSIFESDDFNKIVSVANKSFGLPEIVPEMGLYAINSKDQEREIHIYLSPTSCRFRLYSKGNNLVEDRTDYTKLENKNIIGFLRFIAKIDFNSCHIGEIIRYNYYSGNKLFVSISTNTLAGNLITYYDDNEIVNLFINELTLNVFQKEKISELINKAELKTETIVNKLNCVNNKITSFSNKCGIDLNNTNNSLQAKINSLSNDYSLYSNAYSFIVGKDLLSLDSINDKHLFVPVSIIIPSYNSEQTILQTLYSIESQDLSKDQLSKLEVILIDDGSIKSLKEIIKKEQFSYELKLISLDKNQGLSVARNVGVGTSKHNILIFIDSDIVLSKNYILEHSIRNQIIPNSIFISLKRNVEETDISISLYEISKGINVPDFFDDSRIKKAIRQDQTGIYEQSEDQLVEVLQETNYFRDFGYGRKIGFYDLPTMVVGHNMSMRRSTFDTSGGFPKEFKGWGLEDTFFGAKTISKGNFVIPIISTGVYHINHSPRSGSENQKRNEFEINVAKYKKLISKLND